MNIMEGLEKIAATDGIDKLMDGQYSANRLEEYEVDSKKIHMFLRIMDICDELDIDLSNSEDYRRDKIVSLIAKKGLFYEKPVRQILDVLFDIFSAVDTDSYSGIFKLDFSDGVATVNIIGDDTDLDIPKHCRTGGHVYKVKSIKTVSLNHSLQSVIIPDSVTKISRDAFSGCTSLQSVIIPDSVTKIGYGAFSGCGDVVVSSGNRYYRSVNGVLFTHDMKTILHVPNYVEAYSIPDSVTWIGDSAFSGCTSLKSITIPDSVTKIDIDVFEGCTSLQSVVIPDSVTEIGWSAFEGCTSLQFITIPDSITKISLEAFSGCTSLQSVVIPDSVTKIGYGAFYECDALKSASAPSSLDYDSGVFPENTKVIRRK